MRIGAKNRVKRLEERASPEELPQPIMTMVYKRDGKRYYEDVTEGEKEYKAEEWESGQRKYHPIICFLDELKGRSGDTTP